MSQVFGAWWRWTAVAVATACMVLVQVLWSSPLQQWDEALSSKSWGWADSRTSEARVVVVDIDEKSVQAIGAWPWSRDRMAELLRSLDHNGVQLKVLDVLFDGAQPVDPVLAQAMSQGTTVIGQFFSVDPAQPLRAGALSGALAGVACPTTAPAGHGFMAPTPVLTSASGGVGHINPTIDADGAVRRVPALLCFEGKAYPSLVVAALAAATHSAPALRPSTGWGAAEQVLEVGGFELPVDAAGQMRVSYQLPRSAFISISAIDVLRGNVPSELLKGAWVLVGSTALGGGDSVPTPLSGQAGGVEVHAQLLAAALDARTPFEPSWRALWSVAAGAFAVLLLLGSLRLPGAKAVVALPLAAVLAVAAIYAAHVVLLLAYHQWLPWGRLALFVFGMCVALFTAELLHVRKERERVFHNLATYLPASAAKRVAYAPLSAQVAAQERQATVMFVNLRNFSAYYENHGPQAAASVLQVFYTTLQELVARHGGVVEQMTGESVMAVWNGTLPHELHAASAVGVAEQIWREVSAQLPAPTASHVPPLDVGVGLESGSVMVGSFGPAQRRVHTVMGETVGIASGLQLFTAELGYPILLGPSVAAQCGNSVLQRLGSFLIPGTVASRAIYALPVVVDKSHLHLVWGASKTLDAA